MAYSKLGLFAAVGVVALVTGCSSATNKGDAGVTDPGIDPNNPNKCADKNPAGDCYPTANQGYNPRKGQVAGNRIPNFKFIGYRSANGAATPSTGDTETIQLADFFDPKGEKYKVIRVVVASVWCGPCNQETDYIVQNNLATDLNGQGAVFLQALSDGPVVGTGATLGDLQSWIGNHKSNFTSMLDPQVKNLGVFFPASAVPFNATIDARSMEILSVELGFNSQMKADVTKWISWVNANPPQQ